MNKIEITTIQMEIKNTMVWWLKKVDQSILNVDAETEPMASHIILWVITM